MYSEQKCGNGSDCFLYYSQLYARENKTKSCFPSPDPGIWYIRETQQGFLVLEAEIDIQTFWTILATEIIDKEVTTLSGLVMIIREVYNKIVTLQWEQEEICLESSSFSETSLSILFP